MKEKFNKILISSIILTSLCVSTAYSVDYFQAGIKAYKEGKFSKSEYYFKQASNKYPQNNLYRYWYAQMLLSHGKHKRAQAEYEKIIELAPQSEAAKKSIKAIVSLQAHDNSKKQREYSTSVHSKENLENKLKANTINGIGENYIFNAVCNGKVMRWDSKKMPVKIYIQQSDPVYKEVIVESINDWVHSAQGNLSYVLVNTPQSANIMVYLAAKVDDSSAANEKSGYVTGLTQPVYNGNLLKHVNIKLSTKTITGKPHSKTSFYNTVLHEFGHAFGIYGHSPNEKDVMYAISKEDGSETKTPLSKRDQNTINLLYRLDPEISNGDKKSKKESKVNDLILGNSDFRLNQKLKEAQNYVKQTPRHPKSWSDLADAYADMKKYPEAIKTYKKALSFDKNYEQALNGLAKIYIAKSDDANAIIQYEKLMKINPGSVNYAYGYATLLKKTNQKEKAMSVLNNLYANNPKAHNEPAIRALEKSL